MAGTEAASCAGVGQWLYVEKRNRRGEVTSLECCMPWETTLLNTGGRHTYGVYNEEGAFAVSPDDMIHIRALGNNQKMGLSPIMQHAETIGMGMSGQQYTSAFLTVMPVLPGLFL